MMDARELASLFIQYSELDQQLKAVEEKIQAAVLDLKETQKIAGVTATYYQPSMKTNYEQAAQDFNVSDELIEKNSTKKLVTRWKDVVAEAGIPEMKLITEYSENVAPRVVVKVK